MEKFSHFLYSLPKPHKVILVSVFSVCCGSLLLSSFSPTPSPTQRPASPTQDALPTPKNDAPQRKPIDIDLNQSASNSAQPQSRPQAQTQAQSQRQPQLEAQTFPLVEQSNASAIVSENPVKQALATETIAKRPLETRKPIEIKVKSGDTLAAIFKRAGFSSKDVHQVAQLPHTKKLVKKIRPGDIFYLYQNQDKKFAGLDYQLSPIETLIITPEETGLSERIETKAVEIQTRLITATIRSNFWNAAIDAGVSPNQIMQLATIFGWDIDFALDIRKGDQFTMMFESHYSDGKFLKDGHILAAEFINQRDVFTAFRHSNGEYYSADGRSMRKAFLRSPVDFKYVSSNFNPRRLHPVTGQVKAHRGVDYVAAVGTPIKSAGAGRVIEASYNQYNGNYVFIKHNETYTTKYLHLNKRKVKKGQTVKQGEIIGTLGATGRVTGAHLHYEFIVNGVHRNPRTVQLPKADSIARSERQAFVNTAELQLARLHAFKESHSHLASDMILSK